MIEKISKIAYLSQLINSQLACYNNSIIQYANKIGVRGAEVIAIRDQFIKDDDLRLVTVQKILDEAGISINEMLAVTKS